MSTIRANYVTDAAGTGSPAFANGIKSDTITNAAGSGAPNFPNGLNIGGVSSPVAGTQTFTAVGSITAGDVVALAGTADSVSKPAIITNGLLNGSWVPASSFTYSTSYYAYGRLVKMTDTTYVTAETLASATYGLRAAVNTVAADGTITAGTYVTAASTTNNGQYNNYNSIIKISANKFMMFYAVAANTVYAIVGSISGTTITFGTPVALYAATTFFMAAATNGADQILVHTKNSTSPYADKIMALTVSGTTITAGGSTTWYSLAAYQTFSFDSLAYDPSSDRYISLNANTSNAFLATVFSVSGTTVTVGTTTSFGSEVSAGASYPVVYIRYNSNIGRMVFALLVSGITYYVSTLTISGLNFTRASTSALSNTIVAVNYFTITQNSLGDLILGMTNGSYVQTFNSVIFSPTTYQPYISFLSGGSAVYPGYWTSFDSNNMPNEIGSGFYGQVPRSTLSAVMFKSALTSASNAIGFANATVTNGQSLSVAVNGGICSSLNGLLVGTKYYVDGNGALSPSSSTAIKFMGYALSSTKMFVSPQTGI
jgi:hypothetical protein